MFVAKISDDLIGIATVRVGLGTDGFIGVGNTARTIFFTNVGAGSTHSFATRYTNLTGDVVKRSVTVVTAENHGLRKDHSAFINVSPSISSTYKVKYNPLNRRILVGINTFASSGINTTTNTFTITGHGYQSGDKVILRDNIYYIVKVDNDNFKLSNTYHDATKLKPTIVGIASTAAGEFGLVNPPISAYRSSSVIFDMSDSSLSYTKQTSSYSAFRLNFYLR